MPNRYKGFSLILIFLAGITLGIPFLFSEMVEGNSDIYARSNMATHEKINEDEFFNFDPNRYGMWLPLHFKILGLSLTIHDDVFFSPRFMTLIFSAGTVVLMYYYAFLITKSAPISILSSMLFLFFPQRVFLSTPTLSEPIFVFFLISALILIFKTPSNYWWGLTLLNIASGIRYESWFLLPFIWLVIWKDSKLKFRPIVILGASIFPIFWLLINGITLGNPLKFLVDKYEITSEGWNQDNPAFGDFPLAVSNWFMELSKTLTILGIGLIIYGWYRLVKTENDWKKHVLLLFPFWLLFSLPIQVFLKTMEHYPARYLFIPVATGFPLLAYGIDRFRIKLKSSLLVRSFPVYYHLVLLVGMVLMIQLYVNSNKNFNVSTNFFDNNPEFSGGAEIIKARFSDNPSLTVAFYHNDDPKDRSWLEEYIVYFSKFYDLKQFAKEELKRRLPEEDIIILENARDKPAEIYPQLLLSDYKLEYKGEVLNVYSSKLSK